MFDQALAQLVDDTGADLAIFCDYEGESIALASRGLDDFDVRITGAQLGAVVAAAQRIAREGGQAERMFLSCMCQQRSLLIEALPGCYYVVVGISRPHLEPFARRQLRAVADLFALEL